MPDTHAGKGMPIGGVIACENVVIPNAVGVVIGCGMAYVQTNIPVSLLNEKLSREAEIWFRLSAEISCEISLLGSLITKRLSHRKCSTARSAR